MTVQAGLTIVAIPGTKSPGRLEENAAAADIELSAEDVATLDAALPAGGVAGTRARRATWSSSATE